MAPETSGGPEARLSKYRAVNKVGRVWVEAALDSDSSLFTPRSQTWSERWLEELSGE